MTLGSARPLVAALLVLALAGACQATTTPTPSARPATATAATPPTTSPAATPSPTAPLSPDPTTTPAPDPEPRAYTADGYASDALFTPDGRIILVIRDLNAGGAQVVALDADGAVLPGWPWSAGTTGDPFATAVLGPDESVYVAVRVSEGQPMAYTWTLHRLDTAAQEMPGFPVNLPAGPFCALASTPEGLAYAACENESGDPDTNTGASVTTFSVFRPDGSAVPGWPIRAAGSPTVEGFLADGALVVWMAAGNGTTSLIALRPDGSPQPGWPITTPEDGGSVTIDGAGRVRVTSWAWSDGQCGPATATTYTVLGADGTRLPGWPVGLKGWASEPLVADDGSMTIVTDAGTALRYGLDGAATGGWTASNVSVDVSCYGGSMPVAVDGGGTVVIGDGATLLDASGAVAAGWPVRLPFQVARLCPDCTPGPSAPLEPAIGSDAIYIGVYGNGPRVIALGRDGAQLEAASRVVGKDGDMIDWVRIAPSGQVWALLRRLQDESTMVMLVPVARDRVPAR